MLLLAAPLVRNDDMLPAPYCAPMNMSPRWRSIGPGPPLDGGPGMVVVVFLLLMEPTMSSTTISLIPDGTNLLLTQNGWVLAVK